MVNDRSFSLRAISVARVIGTVVVALGLLVLLGWTFNVTVLKVVLPGLAGMKVNTALCLVLLGSSLLGSRPGADVPSKRYAKVCSVAAAIVGFLSISEYVFGWNLGIDQLLFHDDTPGPYPGRMSPIAAIDLVLLGGALLFLDLARIPWLAQLFACVSGMLSLVALLGYVLDVSAMYAVGGFTSTALHTAAGHLLLSVGVLCVRPQRGLAGIIGSDFLGGVMVRRLLPVVVGVSLGGDWLEHVLERRGVLSEGFSAALFSVTDLSILLALVTWTGAVLSRLDSDRQRGANRLQRLSDSSVIGIIVADTTGLIKEANDHFLGACRGNPPVGGLPRPLLEIYTK